MESYELLKYENWICVGDPFCKSGHMCTYYYVYCMYVCVYVLCNYTVIVLVFCNKDIITTVSTSNIQKCTQNIHRKNYVSTEGQYEIIF